MFRAAISVKKTSYRGFASTSGRSVSFGSWLKLMKPVPSNEKRQLKEKITNIDEKNQQADKLLESNGPVGIDSTKLEIIGLPQQMTKEEYKMRIGDFKVNRWMSSKKITSAAELDEKLISCWNTVNPGAEVKSVDDILDEDLYDLQLRFFFFKELQSKTGHSVSDLVLTEADSVGYLRSHYLKSVLSKKALNYDERKPDALVLDSTTFADLPNVVIEKRVRAGERRSRYQKLMNRVEEYREQQLKETQETTS